MIHKELLDWVHAQSKKLTLKYGAHCDTDRERVYARALKLNEEVGELCAEVLAESGDQRKDKIEKRGGDDLAYEIADVLLCTLLLAEVLGVDPNDALKKKIQKIDKRFADVVVE